MTAFTNHATIEMRSSLRNRQLLFLTYAFPLGFYAMMGLVMTQINPMFTANMIPAMVIFAAMIGTLMGLPDPLVNARDAGIFRSFKIGGVPAINIVSAPMLTTSLHVIVVTVIIVVSATPLFGAPAPSDWGWFVVVTLASLVAFAGLGVLIGVVSSSSRATLLWSQLIFLPSMLLSGLMMPFDMLPSQVQMFARLFPATYAMDAYSGLAYGAETAFNPLASVALLVAGGLLALVLAMLLFNWDRNNWTARLQPAFGLLAILPYVLGMLLL
ncbi:MAG: ABC transporter permease [Anaerolineae bacterium]|nr:ABC transporter permease [Anaerolineae bacterium]MCB9133006.1 ABC transporter permease [Anaerolineales bacterium]MCB9142504.1 ABC transporter permease [Anaerolineales bacterium]